MKNVNDYRKKYSDLRDSILVEIGIIIRKQPNWYLQIQDVLGKLILHDDVVIHSVTVKDFGDEGEKEVVWVGVHDEDYYIDTEKLDIELAINVLEAMYEEVEV